MLLHCPFCGNDLNEQDILDTVYPANRERTLYQVVCACTATMLGETYDDAISKWNTRI